MRAITVLGMVWVAAALASTAAPAAGPVRGTGFAAESAVSFAFNDDPAVYAWLGTTRAVQATVTVTDAGDSSGTVTLAGDSTVTPSTLTFPENDSTPYSAQVTVTLPAASKTYHYTAAIMRATTGRVQDSDAATVAPSPYAAEFEPYHQGVALTTGAMHYAGGPDIAIGNPLGGPGVTFERVYDSRYAKDGLSSPGLSVGWVHNYDTRILTRSDSAWGTVMLRFPDGAVTYLTPPTTITAGQVYDLTAYEGSTAYQGAPYRARGKASASAGQWEYLKLVYRDLSTWTFERVAASTYLPAQLTDGTSGLSIDFSWEDGGGRKRLHEIKAGGGTVTLFHATYGDGGLLSRVDDAILSRKVTYGVTTPQGSAVPCLESASQVQRSDLSAALLRCRYGYDTANANCPLLRTITECLPDTETEGAVSTATYVDDKVVEQTDANGHYTTYTYLSGMTKVERFDAASPNASLIEWTQKYDTANRDTGVIDSGGQETTITYDETHRHLPAMVTTKDQQTITYSYDPCGNLDETIELIDPENSRDLVTDYTYTSYPNFPCGLLTRVTQDNALEERTVVTTVYDQTTGLPVKTIAPAPALGEGVHWRPTQDVQASESATIPDTESMTDATLTAAGLHAVEACREQGRPLWLAFRATSGECPLYLSGTGITVNDVFYPATDDMLLYVADGSSYGQAVLGAGSGHGEVRVLLRFPDIGAGSVSSAYLTLGRTSSAGSVTFHAVVLASDPGEYPVNGRGKRLFDDIGNASETLDTTTVTSAYAYDAQNNLIWTRGPSDDPAQLAITQYEYGTVPGRVQSVIDALGASSQFRYYAASGLLDESEDASHCVTKRYYDYGRLSLLLEQDGRETAYTYNETAKMVTVTLPESNEFVPYHAATRTTLASWGGPATIEEVFDERADDEDPPFRVHETVYGAMGEMRVATTRRGIAYDEALRSEVEYDAAYRTRKVWQGGNTQPTEYVYTKKTATVHAKVTVTSPAGAVSVSELDTYDRPWQTTVRGQPTTRAYDGLGRPTTVTYPAPSETSVTATTHYDGWGRVDSVTRAQDEDSESTVVNGFDATDRPIATTHTRGNVSMTYGGTFTPAGSPFDRTRDTDVTKARYDVLGRPVLTVQPTGGALHRTYDNLGRLTHLRELPTEGTSPSTVSPTVFTYEDATNNRTRVQYPMYDDDEERGWPDFETTEYDGLDRVTKTTDALGTYKTYSYQYLGLPAGITYSDSSNAISYQYDYLLRPDVVADRTGEREYGYIEETGLLDYVDITYDGMPTRRISYEYNSADGTRTEMTLPLGDGSTTGTFHYYRPDSGTEAGRLQSITNPFGRETSWGYREDGAITSQTTDSILETVIDRDRTSGRLNSFTNKVPNSQTIKSAFDTFGYDPENRLTGFTASVTGFTLRQSERLFQYDSFGRLVSDSIYGNPLLTATNDQVWTHDGRGNITHFPEHDALQTTPPDTNNPTYEPWRREHNNDNQWTHYGAYTEAGVLDDTALLGLIGYDINGNPTQYQGHTLHFNADNQLVGWYTVDENDPPVLRADYRDDGLRAWKSVNEDALGHADRTYFLYDGDTLIAEMDADGNVTAVMTWGPLGLVERATWTGVDDDYDGILYTFDPLGNVCQRLDADTGDVLSTDEYDAYGNRLTGHAADPYGYKGQYGYYTDTHPVYDDELEVWVETETGLIYCQQRYYDPAAGRWLTRDPIRHAGGMNLYEYCGGDPVNGVDPSGLRTVSVQEVANWLQVLNALAAKYLAENPQNVNGNANLPNDPTTRVALICNWIRLETDIYKGFQWEMVAGPVDRGFAQYVADNYTDARLDGRRLPDFWNPTLIPGDPGLFMVDPDTGRGVDLPHLFATLNALLYRNVDHELPSGGKMSGGEDAEKKVDALAGWAGDLQSCVGALEAITPATATDASMLANARTLIGVPGYLDIPDMLADIDALNLKAAVSDAVLYGFDFGALVATYYRRDAGNRYGLFKLNMGGAPELQDAAQRYIQVFTPIIKKFSKRWLTQPDILKRELDALANAFVEYVHAHAK